jgi:chorismate dehydratase
MWDFEHPPLDGPLADRYEINRMLPSECASQLASGAADIGLVPIAALATNPGLRILPGCTIASKGRVRSLLLVRRASQPLQALHTVAADNASRSTLAYAHILFHKWGNPAVPFIPMVADLDTMLERFDAAILIGDPALMALEERANRYERTGEDLAYHDLAAVCFRCLGHGRPRSCRQDDCQRLHPIARPRPGEYRCPGGRVVPPASPLRADHSGLSDQ